MDHEREDGDTLSVNSTRTPPSEWYDGIITALDCELSTSTQRPILVTFLKESIQQMEAAGTPRTDIIANVVQYVAGVVALEQQAIVQEFSAYMALNYPTQPTPAFVLKEISQLVACGGVDKETVRKYCDKMIQLEKDRIQQDHVIRSRIVLSAVVVVLLCVMFK